MFFAELITKAVKTKKRKCFLNSNDFEDKNERNPCFNSYSDKKKEKLTAQTSSYSHDDMCKQFYYLSSLRLLDVNIKLKN